MKFPQTATYWQQLSRNVNGDFTYSAPQTIKVRWEEKSELYMSPSGEKDVSKAVVYVKTDMDEEDYLYLGISAQANPKLQSGAVKIKSFGKIPNLKATKYVNKVLL